MADLEGNAVLLPSQLSLDAVFMSRRERAGRGNREIGRVGHGIISFWLGIKLEHQVFHTNGVPILEDFVAHCFEDIDGLFIVIQCIGDEDRVDLIAQSQ